MRRINLGLGLETEEHVSKKILQFQTRAKNKKQVQGLCRSFVVAEVHRTERQGCFIGDIRIVCRARQLDFTRKVNKGLEFYNVLSAKALNLDRTEFIAGSNTYKLSDSPYVEQG